jgi:hypothetical protein
MGDQNTTPASETRRPSCWAWKFFFVAWIAGIVATHILAVPLSYWAGHANLPEPILLLALTLLPVLLSAGSLGLSTLVSWRNLNGRARLFRLVAVVAALPAAVGVLRAVAPAERPYLAGMRDRIIAQVQDVEVLRTWVRDHPGFDSSGVAILGLDRADVYVAVVEGRPYGVFSWGGGFSTHRQLTVTEEDVPSWPGSLEIRPGIWILARND